jgi:DNA-binding transcriptional LysR family regulator
MLDDLNELKTFRAILAEGSLSAAARRLGVTLAVVSKRLSTLEGRAGLRLVHRSTRALSPTEEGARLLADVVHALEAIDAAEGRLAGGRDEPAGALRVSAPIAFGRRCVAPVLGQLTERYPVSPSRWNSTTGWSTSSAVWMLRSGSARPPTAPQ